MLETLKNAWRIAELRKKILYTLFIIFIFRLGSAIPVPFIDFKTLADVFAQQTANGSMLSFIDTFTGGGLSNATIFAMGITPYINASIILPVSYTHLRAHET